MQLVAEKCHISENYQNLFPKRFEEILLLLENESQTNSWEEFNDIEEEFDQLLRIEFLLRAGSLYFIE